MKRAEEMGMNDKPEIINATIESVMLGYEDHDILTAYINLDFGGTHQSFGGYALDEWSDAANKRVATALTGHFVSRVMEVVGVRKWEDLPGKPVRVERTWTEVQRLGNFIKDKWYEPGVEMKEFMDAARGRA